jgi:hypothetical protein
MHAIASTRTRTRVHKLLGVAASEAARCAEPSWPDATINAMRSRFSSASSLVAPAAPSTRARTPPMPGGVGDIVVGARDSSAADTVRLGGGAGCVGRGAARALSLTSADTCVGAVSTSDLARALRRLADAALLNSGGGGGGGISGGANAAGLASSSAHTHPRARVSTHKQRTHSHSHYQAAVAVAAPCSARWAAAAAAGECPDLQTAPRRHC